MTASHGLVGQRLWASDRDDRWSSALAGYDAAIAAVPSGRLVVNASRSAAEQIPHPTKPVTALVALKGVGAATASALLAVMAPTVYPFFDEDVAAQVPMLGPVAWTNGYYAKYATALRERSAQLSALFGRAFTPVMVERALWAARGRAKRDVIA